MGPLARQPVQPVANPAQAVVDFVGMLKDPQWLKDLVAGANEVSKANKLTEEEATNLAAANATIEKAKVTQEKYAGEADRLTLLESTLTAREAKLKELEKKWANGFADLDRQKQEYGKQAKQQDMAVKAREDAVVSRELAVTESERAAGIKESQLAAREQAVLEQEKAWNAASSLVAKKKTNG